MEFPIKISSYINGNFVTSNEHMTSFNPATSEKIAEIQLCSQTQLNEAVKAAKTAFKSWSQTCVKERFKYLLKLADLIENNIDEFARLESMDQGKSISQARDIEMPRVLENFRFFANSALQMEEKCSELEKTGALSVINRSPVGVAAIVTPWNLPLYLLSFKLAPCLIYGNTCVCKPSEVTSVTTWRLCQLISEAGFPAGVVNIVFGEGRVVGEQLVSHPDVDLLTFTGSTVTGTEIQRVTAGQFKKTSLELGGKNAAIVFGDAELNKTIDWCIKSSFTNQGEVCLCTSRIYVHRDLYPSFLKKFVDKARKLVIGDPMKKNTFMGPLVSQVHMEKVISYIKATKGTIRCGYGIDKLVLEENLKGYFVLPTIVTDLHDNDPLMIDEVFGPVTAVVPFDSMDEVVDRVNSTSYGLCASIHTFSQSTALRVAKRLEVGTVWINCWLIRDLKMPFGGWKKSGLGREGQDDSRDFFTEARVICMKY